MMANEMEADFVVVGSGAGGAPLASRLALAGFSVIVLEAGDDSHGLNYRVPAFHGRASEDPETSWQFFVQHYAQRERQSRAYDSKYNEAEGGIFYPRAAALGGCTAHHALITVYPHASDWDHLAQLSGDDSWRHERMRGYFERLENCQYVPRPAVPGYDPSRHGRDGWLFTDQADAALAVRDPQLLKVVFGAAIQALFEQLTSEGGALRAVQRLVRQSDPVEITSLLLAAARDPEGTLRGVLARHTDPNDYRVGAEEGVYSVPLAINQGERYGPREFLLATQQETGKERLNIVTRALATRVVLDGGKRATGVAFLRGPSLYRADKRQDRAPAQPEEWFARARREVILCGGAFNTPQLLMLSNIGPRAELDRLGLTSPRVELEGVGKNLQDRYEVGVVCEMNKDFTLVQGCGFQATDPPDPCLAEWQQHRRGVYTTNGAVLAVIRRSDPSLPDPDLFLFGLPGLFRGYFVGYSEQIEARKNLFTWAILKGHTRNRAGEVTLRSGDPRDVPAINFHYFDDGTRADGADTADLEAVLEGVRFVRRVMGSDGLASWVTRMELLPGGVPLEDDDKVREFIKREAWGHHACGTCQIGADGDPQAVLDGRFRVRGVQGLRVVDASVFPRIPGFFIVTPIYLISEKASDVIIEDARRG
jgi:choline dehydrogenase